LSKRLGTVPLKSNRTGVAGAIVVTLLVDGRLTRSPPDAAAFVVGIVAPSTAVDDALVDGAAVVLVAVAFGEEGAILFATPAADWLVTPRTAVAFLVVARIVEPPVSTARVTTAVAA
jgi:hypothetical protein